MASPKETRESGFDRVLIGDGGGPFQKYGPGAGQDNPEDEVLDGSGRFSWSPMDTIELVRGPAKRQIADDGGES